MKIIETNLKFGSMDTRTSTQRIILHHAAATTCTAEQIHQWHLNNGWAGAGYHFFVRKNGNVYRLRPENKVGAHASGSNYNSIGICAEGNFDTETMSSKQMNSIIDLVNYIKKKYGISKVQKHSDVNSTSCPGKNYPFTKIVNGTKGSTTSTTTTSNSKVSVSTVQSKYNSKFGSALGKISVDGIYGIDTKKHLVKAVQYEMNKQFGSGLAVDGIFGTKSKAAFRNLYVNTTGNITWTCQAMLYCKGYNPNGLDSIYGPGMKSCVKTFQKNKGLAVDGILGKNTAYKLFN